MSRPVTVRFTKEFAAFSLLHFHFSKISTETNPVTWDNLPGISLFQKSLCYARKILGVDDARRLADRRSACNDAMKIEYIP